MKSISPKVKLRSIMYDTIDSNVLIQASTSKNHLSYETEFFVSFSDLNDILNQLQRSNTSIVVSELFIEERLDQNLTQYFLDANSLEDSIVYVAQYFMNAEKKQIRA